MFKVKGLDLLFSIEYQTGSEGDENIPPRKSNAKSKISHKSGMYLEINGFLVHNQFCIMEKEHVLKSY